MAVTQMAFFCEHIATPSRFFLTVGASPVPVKNSLLEMLQEIQNLEDDISPVRKAISSSSGSVISILSLRQTFDEFPAWFPPLLPTTDTFTGPPAFFCSANAAALLSARVNYPKQPRTYSRPNFHPTISKQRPFCTLHSLWSRIEEIPLSLHSRKKNFRTLNTFSSSKKFHRKSH